MVKMIVIIVWPHHPALLPVVLVSGSDLLPVLLCRCVHGVCVPKGSSYSCSCADGYSGQFCDRREESAVCRGRSCVHGECRVTESGEPVCHCQSGYSGASCETGETQHRRTHPLFTIHQQNRTQDLKKRVIFIINVSGLDQCTFFYGRVWYCAVRLLLPFPLSPNLLLNCFRYVY